MSQLPKITVIMPVYRVEACVARAIESIQAQTLIEYEFLIVDDGSPDRSAEIIARHAARDDRLRLLRQENAGAPAARNRALREARGKYVYFMDADDWAEPDMLMDMYELAEKHALQEVVAGFFIDTCAASGRVFSEKKCWRDGVFASQQAFREAAWQLFDRNLLYTPWNKLFLREYLVENEITFPETFWDDFPFNLRVMRDVVRVGVIEKAYYHFIRARAESETACYRPEMYEKREEEHEWLLSLYDHWQIEDAASREMIARRYVERLIGCIENVASPACRMNAREKLGRMETMLRGKYVREALRLARPRSVMMRLMLLPVRMNCAPLCLVEGAFISWVKRKDASLFARLKAGR